MINAIDVIDLLPGELAARLASDPFFADIPVVVAERGNVLAELKRAQAVIVGKTGKSGVAVVVLQVVADDDAPNVAFGPMKLRPAFQVIENVELNNHPGNGTGKSARRVARMIRDIVKPLRLAGLTTEFSPDTPCIEPIPLPPELSAAMVVYQVNFECYESDSEAISQVCAPVFVDANTETPQLAIECDTPGAQIWYTTDDSFPAPTTLVPDSTAQLYAAPIDIPDAGITIRAAGYLDGQIASQVSRAEITVENVATVTHQ